MHSLQVANLCSRNLTMAQYSQIDPISHLKKAFPMLNQVRYVSMDGSVVEFWPATREALVRFPVHAKFFLFFINHIIIILHILGKFLVHVGIYVFMGKSLVELPTEWQNDYYIIFWKWKELCMDSSHNNRVASNMYPGYVMWKDFLEIGLIYSWEHYRGKPLAVSLSEIWLCSEVILGRSYEFQFFLIFYKENLSIWKRWF